VFHHDAVGVPAERGDHRRSRERELRDGAAVLVVTALSVTLLSVRENKPRAVDP
jgi:hypothetical protein